MSAPNLLTLAKAVLIGWIVFAPTTVFAGAKYFKLTSQAGGVNLLKFASGKLACEAARDEDWRELQGEPGIQGTWTFIQLPDENVPPNLANETDCIFNFTGTFTGGSFNTTFHWYVIAGLCPAGQIINPVTNQCGGGFFGRAISFNNAQCGQSCNNVGHPINPTSGAVVDTQTDGSSKSGSAIFNRFYNSLDQGPSDLNTGWRHSFSRFIKANQNVPPYIPYTAGNPDNSSLYNDAASACISGFPEVQSRVANWVGATVNYIGGQCVITKENVNIGTFPILFASSDLPLPSPSVVGYDVIRDDGQLIRFTIQNGQIVAPPSITLKLQVMGSGYTLTDANDTVETYDSNGVLQTIAGRSGVTQTMHYDTSARLSTATDNFGHTLIFSYDTQNRLTSVTRQ